jgi:DNA polymerase (family 10)
VGETSQHFPLHPTRDELSNHAFQHKPRWDLDRHARRSEPARMTRELMAEVLEEIALLLELKGENPFKIRAYRQGAETVRAFEGEIVELAANQQLTGIKGIGEALRDKLHELASTGHLEFHEKLRAEFPPGLFELFDLQGLGPKKVKALHDALGISSIPDLKAACDSGKVATLPGFGAKTQAKILEAIAQREAFADTFLLGGISALVDEMLETLRTHPEIVRVAVAGSFRRAKETVHDLDFLVATKEPKLVCEDFTTLPQVDSILVCGETKASVRLKNGLQCDLRAVSNAQFPFALQYFTGSKEHNVAIRSLALKQGLSLNEYGFTPVDAENPAPIPAVDDEPDIYRALGLDFIPPELRENRGEIEAAADHSLPRLVQLENLRGTFHNHTTASDGADSLEVMAEAAIELGLQYLGIADHSKASFQANGLSEERLRCQIDEIRKLNAGYEKFRLFSGTEVDIHKDGSLDFDDSLLAELDYCVASVHSSFSLSEDEMTQRICRAMENEHVTMLGHLTGRLLLKREGYAVNHAKIIDCAAETRTILELNCSPLRLDMDWRWWKRARDKGVLCSINPDAHSAERLHHLGLGVRLARKGWLRSQDILNTRSLADVEKFLKTPKSKRA